MSRIGKKPIAIPSGVEVKIENNLVTVKGPKGSLDFPISKSVIVKIDGNALTVETTSASDSNVMQGTTNAIIKNMIKDRARNAEEYKKTTEKNMKTNAENRYRQSQLHDIIKTYVESVIRKKLKDCHSKDEMVSYLSDKKNMKSIYGRVCLDIAIKDKKERYGKMAERSLNKIKEKYKN